MASYSGGIPVTGNAQWNGNQQLATKKQLLSSINGLYLDIQDIELSSITAANLNVSTLTAFQYISTPELYVSSIIGGGLQVNNGFLQISTGDFSFVSLSTLSFKGIDLGGIDFTFDLGLGNAIGGFLGGLGGLVGGAFIGLGTGTGLAIQGITNGLFSLANTQGGTQINNSVFETINGSTQLQISTLGNAYPFYSSIFRSVSSISPNAVPGQEIFLSTIFPAGTTAIRSVSDPIPILTTNSTINTSTIQSFGQWVPFLDPSVTSEDIFARNATFSTLVLYPPSGGIASQAFQNNTVSDVTYWGEANNLPQSFYYPTTSNNTDIAKTPVLHIPHYQQFFTNATIGFISTPYTQYTSSIGNSVPGGIFFIQSTITSSLTSIPKFTYVGNALGGANFATCEPDETSFLSTYTLDLVAQTSNIFLQWGLAVDNLNSTIAVGTSKRVSWNIDANTSNFIDIPQAQSTLVTNPVTVYQLKMNPLECEINVVAGPDTGFGGQGALSFNVSRAVFGINDTSFDNQPGYPYQFNNNLYVNGTLEADQIIALSSFVSTNIVNFFSTTLLDADEADITFCKVSTLFSTDWIGGNGISSFGIETYNNLSQFSYVSTLVVDFQIFANLTPGVKCYLQEILGSNNAYITTTNGTFQNLSTFNLSTANLLAQSITGFSTLLTSTITTNTLFSSNASFSNLNTSNTLLGQFATLSSLTTSSINVNTVSSQIQTLQNLNFSTLTIPNLNYSSFVFNSTTVTYTNEQPTSYLYPTTGYGRDVAQGIFPIPTVSTSAYTTITYPIVLPFNDKMFRLECTCGYTNANRNIQAALAVFVNQVQGPTRTLYANQNPSDFLFDPQVTFVIDPRFYGVINTLDLRFFLSGAPQAGELVNFDGAYFSFV